MDKLLSFDTMITPKIITIVYWIGLVVVLIVGVGTIFAGNGFLGVLTGLAAIAGGALLVRVYCELLIVFFKINEALQDIRNK